MKPFLVLKKVKLVDAEQSSNIELADSSKVELEVVGIIRHKILFKTRPKDYKGSYFQDYKEVALRLLP